MKRIVSILLIALMIAVIAVPAFATPGGDTRTGIASGGSGQPPISTPEIVTDGHTVSGSGSSDKLQDALDSVYGDIPNISTEDIVGRLENKGNDVIRLMQTIGRYVCIVAFIICCIMTLVGIIANPKLLWAGVIGLIISGLAYAGIVCGRDIVNWIASWAIS